MKFSLSLLLSVLSLVTMAQMNIVITDYPKEITPLMDHLFMASSLNNWNEQDPNYAFTLVDDQYQLTIPQGSGAFEFKITRGSWDMVEGSVSGGFIQNRDALFEDGTTLEISVAGWEDFPGNHSLEPTMRVLDTDLMLPSLGTTRRVWVQLPEGYFESDNHYPVLYLQDGQNLFNNATSFVGEWEVDETMNALDSECPQSIVVGIDNGGAERINEYSPWVHPEYGGGDGELYAQDLIETIKPTIDDVFRTLPQREYTGVGGSSLGGLISLYILLEHQEVFSKGLIASPSLWFSDGIYDLAENSNPMSETRCYLFGGLTESSTMVSNMEDVEDVLLNQGFADKQITVVVHEDGAHSEWYWAREYEDAYKWLFGDLASVIGDKELFKPLVGPIPTSGPINIQLPEEEVVQVDVWSMDQQLITSRSNQPSQLQFDLSALPSGIYVMMIRTQKHNYYQRIIKE